MKSLLLACAIALTVPAFATEFDENQEKVCIAEAKKLGCVKNDVENTSCMQKNKSKLSAECKKMQEAKSN